MNFGSARPGLRHLIPLSFQSNEELATSQISMDRITLEPKNMTESMDKHHKNDTKRYDSSLRPETRGIPNLGPPWLLEVTHAEPADCSSKVGPTRHLGRRGRIRINDVRGDGN